MSLSVVVVGYRQPDERWAKMKAVYDACTAAHVPVPDVVVDFFDGGEPDLYGVPVDLCGAAHDFHGADEFGIVVHTSSLPAGVQYLRFVVSR